LIQQLLEELKELGRIDDDDLMDFLHFDLVNDADDDVDDIDQSNFNFDENTVFTNFNVIGKALWDENPDFRNNAREIAAKLIIQFIEGSMGKTHSLPIYKSKPSNRGDLNDLDIEGTLENILENPNSPVTPLIFERQTSRNPVVIMLDTSLSMNGTKLLYAGLSVAILSRLIPSQDLAVLGFDKEVYPIKNLDEEISSFHLVNRLFQLNPKGGTNLSEALKTGGKMIFQNPKSSKLILMTDADPSAGGNPIPEAAKLPTLDILLFPDGNEWLAKQLIKESMNGRIYPLNSFQDVVASLQSLFSQN
jgi:hypothetical protein